MSKRVAQRGCISENSMVSLHQCKSEAELVLTLGFIKDTCHAGAPNTISKSDEGLGDSGEGNAPVSCL